MRGLGAAMILGCLVALLGPIVSGNLSFFLFVGICALVGIGWSRV